MKAKNRILINIIIGILTITSPILFLIGVLEANIAFPIMFTMIGVQQISLSLNFSKGEHDQIKKLNLIVGISFMIFGLGIVLPFYLFVD